MRGGSVPPISLILRWKVSDQEVLQDGQSLRDDLLPAGHIRLEISNPLLDPAPLANLSLREAQNNPPIIFEIA